MPKLHNENWQWILSSTTVIWKKVSKQQEKSTLPLTKFDFSILCQQDVLAFDVTVDDVVGM